MDYELLLKIYYEKCMPLCYSRNKKYDELSKEFKDGLKGTHGFNIMVARFRIEWYRLFGLDKLCMN